MIGGVCSWWSWTWHVLRYDLEGFLFELLRRTQDAEQPAQPKLPLIRDCTLEATTSREKRLGIGSSWQSRLKIDEQKST